MASAKIYKIEKGIKVPAVAINREPSEPSAAALTLQKLDKGESFLIKDELDAIKAVKVVRDAMGRERARKSAKEFTTRKVGTGVRIWRVK